MRKQLRPYSCFNSRRASAIIGALVITGIVALAVGIMLSTTRTAIRRSADRLTYEEAYQAALAGTHIARAWLVDPPLVGTMSGNFSNGKNASTTQADIQNLVDRATAMNKTISTEVAAKLLAKLPITNMNLYGTSRYATAGFTIPNTSLSGGRKLLYHIPCNPLVTLINNAGQPKFTKNLFQGTPAGGHKNYVEWVRITTPGTDAETSASLRETTFIVEAKGVSEYAGVKKERVVQQRILIKPNKPGEPLLSATESILTGGAFSAQSMSSGNVHWGPVLAKGDITNPFINIFTQTTQGKLFKGWELTFKQSQKANMAGAGVAESGNNGSNFNGILDTKLQWKTGVNGKIYGYQGEYMFKNLFPQPVGEFDFFKSLLAGTLNIGLTPINKNNLELDSAFTDRGTDLTNPLKYNGLYDTALGSGAMVQKSPSVDTRINSFFGDVNYEKLKTYAQSHDAYYTWNGSTLKNAAGTVVSMPTMTPGNTDTLAANAVSDRMLFVDSVAGTEATPFTKAVQLPAFWKGVVYANGPIETSGAGSAPNIIMRSPEQFTQFRQYGSSTPAPKEGNGVFVDGIVICNGTADLGANGAIYGTLAAKTGVITGANFSIFYNSANGEGRMKDTSTGAQPYNLIAGKLYETKVPSS